MSALFDQLTALFEAQDWRYQRHPQAEGLTTGFGTERGSVVLNIDVEGATALRLTTRLPLPWDPALVDQLAPLLQALPVEATLEPTPDAAAAQLRLTLPVPDGALTQDAFGTALSLMLSLAPPATIDAGPDAARRRPRGSSATCPGGTTRPGGHSGRSSHTRSPASAVTRVGRARRTP